jgi:hypothetical protein
MDHGVFLYVGISGDVCVGKTISLNNARIAEKEYFVNGNISLTGHKDGETKTSCTFVHNYFLCIFSVYVTGESVALLYIILCIFSVEVSAFE